MDIDKIKGAKTKVIGKKIEYFKEIGSTHVYSKEKGENQQNGVLVIAEVQTGGVGTNGRFWYTGENKNIAMTITLKPKCNVEKLSGLTVKIAEVIKESIYEMYGYSLEIKKPNDLLFNSKKIGGILTQISSQANKIKYLLISIGFNVNEEEFPEKTKDIATSLKREMPFSLKGEYSREDIIIKIIEKLEERINLEFSE